MAGVNMLELVQLSEQFSKTASPGRGGAGGGGGGHGSASTGAAKAEAASGGAAVASAAAAFGAASPSAAAGSGGKAAGAFSAGLGGAFVARAAARLKAKAAKAVKSRYYLRMQPLDDDHPPIGLPLRELLIQTFNYKRDRTMWEFLVYAVYVAVFLAVVYQLNDTQLTQNANGNVFDAFLDESMTSLWSDATPLQPPQNEVTYQKTFFDIGDFPELSQWLTTVFVPVFYQTSWYNGDPYSATETGFVRRYMQIIQGARIRQARVTNTSCSLEQRTVAYAQRFKPPGGGCYGEYVFGDSSDVKPFGPPGDPARYRYYAPLASSVEGLAGYGVTDYGNGGYVVYLPTDATNGTALINQLLTDRFFDKQTRMVTIDFNLYNSDTGYLTVARFTLEMLRTGNILPLYRLYSIKMLLYETSTDKLRAAGEIFVVLGTLYYLAKELRQLRQSKPWYKYFTDWSNAFDLSLQVLMLICIAFWLLQIINPLRHSFAATTACAARTTPTPNAYGANTCYVDLFELARNFQYAVTTAGMLGLCMVLKLFKFFALSRRMNTLWLTLSKAASSLAGFGIGFMLVVGGFAFMAQQAFGSLVAAFHTFPAAFSTLMRYPLGDFAYTELALARPDVAPLFFFMYIILVFLVSMNMVVAIITAAFEEVSRGLKEEEKWKHVTSSYWLHVVKKTRRYVLLLFLLFRYVCGDGCATFLCCCGGCIVRSGSFAATAGSSSRSTRNLTAGIPVGGGGRGSRQSTLPGGAVTGAAVGGSAGGMGSPSKSVRFNPLHAFGSEGLDPAEAELNALTAEATFVDLVRRWISASEGHHHTDLLSQFEEVYKTSPAGCNLYIGLNELCEHCRDDSVALDDFCRNGHQWKRLGLFRMQKARKAAAAAAAAGQGGLLGRLRRVVCCGRGGGGGGSGDTLSTLDDLETGAASDGGFASEGASPTQSGGGGGSGAGAPLSGTPGAATAAAPKAAWTHNPLRDGPMEAGGAAAAGGASSTSATAAAAAGASLDALALDELRRSYKPRCVAWQLVGAYNAFKDCVLLGPSERHAHTTDKSFGISSATDDETQDTPVDDITARRAASIIGRQPGSRGRWQVIKINRNDTRQRRFLSIKEEGPGVFVICNHDLRTRLKRRFAVSSIMQVEASIPNPRRCSVYIEAEAVESGDPLARFAITADTVYDLLFSGSEERDAFINTLVKTREAMIKAAEEAGVDPLAWGAARAARGRSSGALRAATATSTASVGSEPPLTAEEEKARADAIAKISRITRGLRRTSGAEGEGGGSGRPASLRTTVQRSATSAQARYRAESVEEEDTPLTFRRSTVKAADLGQVSGSGGFLEALVHKQQVRRASRHFGAAPLVAVVDEEGGGGGIHHGFTSPYSHPRASVDRSKNSNGPSHVTGSGGAAGSALRHSGSIATSAAAHGLADAASVYRPRRATVKSTLTQSADAAATGWAVPGAPGQGGILSPNSLAATAGQPSLARAAFQPSGPSSSNSQRVLRVTSVPAAFSPSPSTRRVSVARLDAIPSVSDEAGREEAAAAEAAGDGSALTGYE